MRSRAAIRGFLAALMFALACNDATDPARPAAIVLVGATPVGVVGQTLAPSPQIQIRDTHGRALAGVAFTVTVVAGNGSLAATPQRSVSGSTPVGAWTLGNIVGVNSLIVRSPGVPSLTISVTSTPGPPATATAVGPTNGEARAGTASPLSPAVRVEDAFGNAAPGVSASVVVGTASGTVASAPPFADASGIVSTGPWNLGSAPGIQTVSITVTGLPPVVFTVIATEPFNITLRFIGTVPSPAIQTAFTNAVNRMEQVIVNGLPSVSANMSPAVACGDASLPLFLSETVDDLIIYAVVSPIDGVSGILGQAGPCAFRTSGSLPYVGFMQFDVADANNLVNAGTFGSVVLHEMQHVLGLGTLWRPPDFLLTLLTGVGSGNPIFTGAGARAAYLAAGGTSSAGVPVQATGGPGSVNSHWREGVFFDELMTPFLTGTVQPFSRMSMASLADLGYTVSFATADPYTVPSPGQLRAGLSAGVESENWERLITPASVASAGVFLAPRRR